jgi:hypothetical protein
MNDGEFLFRCDSNGHFERECPICNHLFKVHGDDWKKLFKDEAVYCPSCGRAAKSDKWFSREQLRVMDVAIKKIAEQAIHDSLMHSKFLRPTGPRPLAPRQVPIPSSADLPMLFQCGVCHARFSDRVEPKVCPCCGRTWSPEQ